MLWRPQFSLKTLLALPVAVAIFFGGMATQRYCLRREYAELSLRVTEALEWRSEALRQQIEVDAERGKLERLLRKQSDIAYRSVMNSKLWRGKGNKTPPK